MTKQPSEASEGSECGVSKLRAAIDFAQRIAPLPRCVHGSCLQDAGGERLEPPCGCRFVPAESAKKESGESGGPWMRVFRELHEIHAELNPLINSDAAVAANAARKRVWKLIAKIEPFADDEVKR